MLRRFAALALAVAASLGASACGENEKELDGELAAAESEALYVPLDGLKYQVQLSRQLNPRDIEDADYFKGISPEQSVLPEGGTWFGVFIRVENEGEKALESAEAFEVEDTRGNAYEPVETENLFTYQPQTVQGGEQLPNSERLQAYAGTNGTLLLFKLDGASLDNRPLELKIQSVTDADKAAIIDLDV